mmetsp:Transcript_20794/g.42746  ORF Transcript_20794/g.42746 Transcript_20794/m.42746 type:complete len:210 (-) Transcript_20794:748-1377(-)
MWSVSTGGGGRIRSLLRLRSVSIISLLIHSVEIFVARRCDRCRRGRLEQSGNLAVVVVFVLSVDLLVGAPLPGSLLVAAQKVHALADLVGNLLGGLGQVARLEDRIGLGDPDGLSGGPPRGQQRQYRFDAVQAGGRVDVPNLVGAVQPQVGIHSRFVVQVEFFGPHEGHQQGREDLADVQQPPGVLLRVEAAVPDHPGDSPPPEGIGVL